MVDIGVRGDQSDAFREWEIELTDDFQALVDGVFIADVDQGPIICVIIDKIDTTANPPARLMIERCRGLVADPPGSDWTPVAVQMDKST